MKSHDTEREDGDRQAKNRKSHRKSEIINRIYPINAITGANIRNL